MKLSCCPNSLFGIPEEAFKQACIEGIFHEGDPLPCLSCFKLYRVKNWELVFYRNIGKSEYADMMANVAAAYYELKVAKIKDEAESFDSKFMRDLNIKL